MANSRTNDVVMAVVEGIRGALLDKAVTFPEYRAAIQHIMKTSEAGELPLMIDVFFNTTIVQAINNQGSASPSDLEGPYFIEDVPLTEGTVLRMDGDDCEPLLVAGTVAGPDGAPLSNATVYIWSSTPDGKYSGFHPGVPDHAYRAKLMTDENGAFRVETSTPVPYQIPNQGPTGELLEAIGRHTWRPAHVHFKVRAEGCEELTTQAYFEEGEYVHDDCCEGIVSDELIFKREVEDGKRVVRVNFKLDAARALQAA